MLVTYGACRKVNEGLDRRVWGHGVSEEVFLSRSCLVKRKE